jgi:glycosyltransferase involved in cell wall biosynthesis
MNAMRILMISDVYFPRVNGVSTSIQTFARNFASKGHGVTVIAPDYGQDGARLQTLGPAPGQLRDASPEPDGFEIVRIPSRYLPLDPEDRVLRASRIRRHHDRLSRGGFDLVHVQTPFVAHYAGLRIARRLGIPVIESYHTFFEQYVDKYVTFLPPAWLRLAARHLSVAQCRAVDGLVVPSHAMLEVLEAYGVRTPAAVIPTGIEPDRFDHGDGERFRRRHGIDPDRPVLVHVGRLAFEKNIDFLLHMLPEVRRVVPDVLLVIAGEGPARRSLEALTAELGLTGHVCFVGYLSRDGALEDCYCAGDAFVFASRTETQGLVLLEAMALGVPVVSTAVMGTKEVLGGGKGSLIAREDTAEFAAKAARLLTDADLRATLGEQARAYARAWSAPALAERMLELYRSVACAAGNRRSRDQPRLGSSSSARRGFDGARGRGGGWPEVGERPRGAGRGCRR